MSQLTNLITQLSDNDHQTVLNILEERKAEKSASLLKLIRNKKLTEKEIRKELQINSTAYYTRKTRLNQFIEEYLVTKIENSPIDILKQLGNLNVILYDNNKTITLAVLKKLEKELLDHDLCPALTLVYKSLKKLHVNSQEEYDTYNKLYNQHVAYMLAADKIEDLISHYLKKYGQYMFTFDEQLKAELFMLVDEIKSYSILYDSHRLYVLSRGLFIFHKLYVIGEETLGDQDEPIEDMLKKVEEIFNNYPSDSIYNHLRLMFEYLRLEYYSHYNVLRKAEDYYNVVNVDLTRFLTHYNLFTFPSQFLITKIKRHLRTNTQSEIYEENKTMFADFEIDKENLPQYIIYVIYQALSCYYAKQYNESAKWLNHLLNDVSLRRYPVIQIEIKTLLALQYCMQNDYELFIQQFTSIQRLIRINDGEDFENITLLAKALKVSMSLIDHDKSEKVTALINRITPTSCKIFRPITSLIRFDIEFIESLCDASSMCIKKSA